jgi:two-component system, cell cycle response regulator DivK
MELHKSTRSRVKPPLVLVVDDFRDAREMYAEVLELAGFRVEQAENGLDAVTKAKRLLPAVVIMDLSLPVMDGWEATRQIKANKSTRAVKVIAISAHSLEMHVRRAREVGCAEFIAKPCLPDDLIDAVRRQIEPAKEHAC